ncbi:MAG: hypothetical protein EG828_00515 [Deltaproteobacteria bacterium]|nr:hypothetical protein [Deltaproteobacteria bacterium]
MSTSSILKIYYIFKPLLPRSLQILLRRCMVIRKLRSCADIWPIDGKSARPPGNWIGWPEGKRFALILTHDVEAEKGQEKCRNLMKLEEDMGFRSSFNFVPGDYHVNPELLKEIKVSGFEVGVHGWTHDGSLYKSREIFLNQAHRINEYLKKWEAVGFRSPAMHHNLDWLGDLDIEYDLSTFDTDPFEPQPDGMGTIFPFLVKGNGVRRSYIEMPYTLPQDFTLFIIMRERTIDIWKRKLDWVVEQGGMVLLNTHPDYMNFGETTLGIEEYPARYYEEFLDYVRTRYEGQYWNALPRETARYCMSAYSGDQTVVHDASSSESQVEYEICTSRQ